MLDKVIWGNQYCGETIFGNYFIGSASLTLPHNNIVIAIPGFAVYGLKNQLLGSGLASVEVAKQIVEQDFGSRCDEFKKDQAKQLESKESLKTEEVVKETLKSLAPKKVTAKKSK